MWDMQISKMILLRLGEAWILKSLHSNRHKRYNKRETTHIFMERLDKYIPTVIFYLIQMKWLKFWIVTKKGKQPSLNFKKILIKVTWKLHVKDNAYNLPNKIKVLSHMFQNLKKIWRRKWVFWLLISRKVKANANLI